MENGFTKEVKMETLDDTKYIIGNYLRNNLLELKLTPTNGHSSYNGSSSAFRTPHLNGHSTTTPNGYSNGISGHNHTNVVLNNIPRGYSNGSPELASHPFASFEPVNAALNKDNIPEFYPNLATPRRNNILQSIKYLTKHFRDQHSSVLQNLVKDIDASLTESDVHSVFNKVLEELFSGNTNWGRIIAMIVFCEIMQAKTASKFTIRFAAVFCNWAVEYINTNLATWIENNGGWDGIVEFRNSNQDEIWNSLKGVFKFAAISGVLYGMIKLLR